MAILSPFPRRDAVVDSTKRLMTASWERWLRGVLDTLNAVLFGYAALNFDLTSVASQDLTVAVVGARLGNPVSLGIPHGSVTADTVFMAWVSADDVVTVRATRVAGTPNQAAGVFTVLVWRLFTP